MKTWDDLALSLVRQTIFSSVEILLLSLRVSQYMAVKTLTT